MQSGRLPLRQVRIATLFVCILAGLFLLFFNLSKHDPLLSPANVFGEDPYDAVASLGVQLAFLAAALSFLRILKPGPCGAEEQNSGLVLRGDLVALLSILVTIGADGVALLRYLPAWTGLPGGIPLLALILGLLVLTLLALGLVLRLGRALRLNSGPRSGLLPALVCLGAILILTFYPDSLRQGVGGAILTALTGIVILFLVAAALTKWIFPPGAPPHGDFLDDLTCVYQAMKTHAGPLAFLFAWAERVAQLPAARLLARLLNPRRHTWDIILLTALLVGMGLVIAESLAEDGPTQQTLLLVLSVFIGLEAAGVALGYLLFNSYLHIFRTR